MIGKDKGLPLLELHDGALILDGTEIPAVEEYELKSSAAGTAELRVKILVATTGQDSDCPH
nr:MAG TPA: hypothetical protein [Caudoviricetes sp.]